MIFIVFYILFSILDSPVAARICLLQIVMYSLLQLICKAAFCLMPVLHHFVVSPNQLLPKLFWMPFARLNSALSRPLCMSRHSYRTLLEALALLRPSVLCVGKRIRISSALLLDTFTGDGTAYKTYSCFWISLLEESLGCWDKFSFPAPLAAAEKLFHQSREKSAKAEKKHWISKCESALVA